MRMTFKELSENLDEILVELTDSIEGIASFLRLKMEDLSSRSKRKMLLTLRSLKDDVDEVGLFMKKTVSRYEK